MNKNNNQLEGAINCLSFKCDFTVLLHSQKSITEIKISL
jgi:hypothetical protein